MRYEPLVHAPIGSFDETILPHLGAAHNLARWLVRGSDDAEDVVQEACLGALRYFGTFRGGNARAWLLKVVRTTAIRSFQKNRAQQLATEFNEEIHSEGCEAVNPETLLLQRADTQLLEQAMNDLPVRWREVLMLRELEGLSYKEIAEVVGVPMGTVMSTLFRARERLRDAASYPVRRRHARKARRFPSDSERQELKQRAVPIKQPPPRNEPRLLQAPAVVLPRALQSAPDARNHEKTTVSAGAVARSVGSTDSTALSTTVVHLPKAGRVSRTGRRARIGAQIFRRGYFGPRGRQLEGEPQCIEPRSSSTTDPHPPSCRGCRAHQPWAMYSAARRTRISPRNI